MATKEIALIIIGHNKDTKNDPETLAVVHVRSCIFSYDKYSSIWISLEIMHCPMAAVSCLSKS